MRPKLYANTTGSKADHKHQEPRRQYGYEIKTINRRSEEERSRRKRKNALAIARGS